MMAAILADLVLIFHFLFIVFALLGALMILYRHWFIWLHIPVMAWAAMVSLMGWICPLTPLENYFRQLAGQTVYSESFVAHYLLPLIYPQELTRDIQIGLGFFVIIWNILIYTYLYKQSRNKK